MAFLQRSRKVDLCTVASELGLDVGENFKIVQLVDLIIKAPNYDETVVKEMLQSVAEERVANEERERLEKQQRFELEKLKLQIECQRLAALHQKKLPYLLGTLPSDMNASKTVAPLTVNNNDRPDHLNEDEDNFLTSVQKKSKDHPDHLREDEGIQLTADQKEKLNDLLPQFESTFPIGGEATSFIDTQNRPPVSVPPSRVSLARKEIMKNSSKTVAPLTVNNNDRPDHLRLTLQNQKQSDSPNHLMLEQQDRSKSFAEQKRKPASLSLCPLYSTGDLVLVAKPHQSNKNTGVSSKFMPRRDGPFVIVQQRSPVSYSVANPDFPDKSVGVYHTSALTPFHGKKTFPMKPLRKRGRPPKTHNKQQKEPTRGSCTNSPSSPTPTIPTTQVPVNSRRLSADPWSGRQRGRL